MIEFLFIAILISCLLAYLLVREMGRSAKRGRSVGPEVARPDRFLRHQNTNNKARNRVARIVSRDNPKMRRK